MSRCLSRRLHLALGRYLETDPIGELFLAPFDVVRIYEPRGDGYARARELSREADDTLTSPLFPGLELRLQTIFTSPE